ncbi:AAA family ATPase [Rhodoblastus sp.]|jgi:histone H3/H4|uniref:AAA family ATPase n=1 Tax=Rhodoblastus sp. TaxID=1962975 RepID=UPI0025F2668C|nr:AAA family ATPase [Rhodoblastus sp.]
MPKNTHADDADRTNWRLPRPEPASIQLYEPAQLKALIEVAGGNSGGDFGVDSDDRKRIAALERVAASFLGPERKVLTGTPALVDDLDALKQRIPSFGPVVDLFRREALASSLNGAPMRVTPLLLVGPPGIGKTYAARRLAAALGETFVSISMTLCDDVGDLVGHSASWRAARPGLIATTLLDDLSASPVILVDEIEKAPHMGHQERPHDIFLNLFEPENASAFADAFLGLEIRADHLFWLCTANATEGIPAPVLDRMLIIPIEPPEGAERRYVAQNVFNTFAALRRSTQRRLDADALAILAEYSPRLMGKLLLLASGYAAERGTMTILADDLERAKSIAKGEDPMSRIGFI